MSDESHVRQARAADGKTAGQNKDHLTGAALVQRWKELGLIGYRSDITDPEAHSRRLREDAQQRLTEAPQ